VLELAEAADVLINISGHLTLEPIPARPAEGIHRSAEHDPGVGRDIRTTTG
jgi:hypothetical protein